MKRRGIELPVRSKNAGKEPVNKGTGKVRYCLNCGKVIDKLNIVVIFAKLTISINSILIGGNQERRLA